MIGPRRSIVGLVIATAVALGASATPLRALDVIAALLLVLVLPGVALVTAVDPSSARLEGAHRWFWCALSSIGISIAGGLFLNLAGGLTRLSWCLFLGTVAIAASAAAWVRTARITSPQPPGVAGAGRRAVSPRSAVLLACAALLVAGALGLSQVSSSRSASEHFVQLWMIPRPFDAGAFATRVQLGIRNDEGRPATFLVVVTRSGKALRTWRVHLAEGRSWTQAVPRSSRDELAGTVSLATDPTQALASVHFAALAS